MVQRLNTYVIFLYIAKFPSIEIIVFCILSSNDLDFFFPMASVTNSILLNLKNFSTQWVKIVSYYSFNLNVEIEILSPFLFQQQTFDFCAYFVPGAVLHIKIQIWMKPRSWVQEILSSGKNIRKSTITIQHDGCYNKSVHRVLWKYKRRKWRKKQAGWVMRSL